MAYETRGRDPFKAYSPFDFEMDKAPIKINAVKAKVNVIKENRLIAQLHTHEFMLEIMGFDLNRDLTVKIEPVGAIT